MSLPAIAQHMSSYGRNGDTMLVHMTPSEVHGLQALALKHGTTLTINPDTGLPEAFSLKSLVKAAAPIALGALLGPAGMGIASSAMGAGFMVGGVTALATGNLQQGLMAGLGAYGGYGLSEGLAGMGAQEIAQQQADDMIVENAAKKASESAAQTAADAATTGTASETALNTTQQAAANQQSLANSLQATPPTAAGEMVKTTVAAPSTAPSYFDKISTGLNQATSSGGLDALSAQMKTAGGPSLSNAAMATAGSALGSGLLDQKNPAADAKKLDAGYIRPYSYNPFGQKFTAYTPVKADEWGSRSMATGGIVALAGGGSLAEQRLADYKQFEGAPQSAFTDAQTAAYIKNNNISGQGLQDMGNVFGINQDQRDRAQQLISVNDPRIAEANNTYQAQIAANPTLEAQNRAFYDPATRTGTGVKAPAVSDESAFNTVQGYSGKNLSDAQMLGDLTSRGISQEQLGRISGAPAQQLADRYKAAPFNRMTGGSKAAYDYLTGSGEYTVKPWTPTGEVFKPYAEATMGMKADPTQFATTFNPETRTYEDNPNYKAFTTDPETGKETRGMSQAELAAFVANPDNLGTPTNATGWMGKLVEKVANKTAELPVWMEKNNLSYEQLASALKLPVDEVKRRYPVTGGQNFDSTAYLAANPDVATALKGSKNLPADAWKHYTDYGQKEGRAYTYGAAKPTNSIFFDPGFKGFTPEPVSNTGEGANGGLMPNDLSYATGGITALAGGGQGYNLGGYSDGGRLLKGPGDGVSDSIPAQIGDKQPARLADGEFVVPARIVSELGNGSTEAGARKLYQMMDRVQKARGKTTGKGKVAANSRSEKYLPA